MIFVLPPTPWNDPPQLWPLSPLFASLLLCLLYMAAILLVAHHMCVVRRCVSECDLDVDVFVWVCVWVWVTLNCFLCSCCSCCPCCCYCRRCRRCYCCCYCRRCFCCCCCCSIIAATDTCTCHFRHKRWIMQTRWSANFDLIYRCL